ncbi:helix-turn-helix transcriptional regulator [Muricoccus nepalensis]|uniref:helix-turn-helix transcriptional regulator n=1 Tax=Muricoccus nepalensis TaxID=1854500 RepID=UPI001F4FF363|nr:helix-turn-helix domain-containing protein [Roseomonas nepalensis]
MLRSATTAAQANSPAMQRPAVPELVAVKHLTQFDLANRWRLSHRTLERWRYDGKGPTYLKLGGAVVYRLEDVEAYEAAQQRAAARQAAAQLADSEKFALGMSI